jgi:hypothetical protein
MEAEMTTIPIPKPKSIIRSSIFNGEPDYEFWQKKEVWLLPDSAKLLCGRDPMSKYPGKPIYNQKLKVIDIIDQAFEATRNGRLRVVREALLPNHILVAPKEFLYWAGSAGFEIPAPFTDMCVREPEIVSTVPHDILKERMQAGAQVLWSVFPEMPIDDLIQHRGMKVVIGDDEIPGPVIFKWIEEFTPKNQDLRT